MGIRQSAKWTKQNLQLENTIMSYSFKVCHEAQSSTVDWTVN